MIALTIVMKTTDINVMIENVTQKLNLLARRTNNGEDLNVFPRNGFVMEILIVLMVLTKIQHSITAQHHSHAPMISLHVVTVDVSIKDGFVIMIMTAETVQMRANSVIHSTRHAHHKNLHVKTLSV